MTKNETVAKGLASGLGALVSWDLEGTKVTPTRLREILADDGFSLAVEDIEPVSAVRRAVRSFSKGRGNDDRYRTDVAAETVGVSGKTETIRVGILRLRRDAAAGEVGWEQVDAATFDASTATWTELPTTPEGVAFVELADERRTYLDADYVRPEIIQASLDQMACVPLRRNGGFYYVPSIFLDDLSRLGSVVAKIGSSKLLVIHAMDTAESRATLGGEVRSHIADGLAGFRTRLDAWKASTRKVRDDAATSALLAFRELREQSAMYVDALGVTLDDLVAEIDDATEEARILFERGAGSAVASDGTVSESSGASGVSQHTIEFWRTLIADLSAERETFEVSGEELSARKAPRIFSMRQAVYQNGRAGLALAALGWSGSLVRAPKVVVTLSRLVAPSEPVAVVEPVAQVESEPVEAPAVEAAPETETEIVEPEIVVEETDARTLLASASVTELRAKAREVGLKGYSRMTQEELRAKLCDVVAAA
jgi:hypothetical protein